MSHFDAKANACFQVEVCGKLFQIVTEFRAAIELFKIFFRRYIGQPFAKTGKLCGVFGGGGDKIWPLIAPTTAHRIALLEANYIC